MSIISSETIQVNIYNKKDSFLTFYFCLLNFSNNAVPNRSYISNFVELFNSEFSLDTTFVRGVTPQWSFAVKYTTSQSWSREVGISLMTHFWNLLYAKGRNLTRPEVMLYYVSLALAVSTSHDNRFHSVNDEDASFCICFSKP